MASDYLRENLGVPGLRLEARSLMQRHLVIVCWPAAGVALDDR